MYTLYIHHFNQRDKYTIIDKDFAFDIIETAYNAIDFDSLIMVDALTGEVLLMLNGREATIDEIRQIKHQIKNVLD